MTQVQTKKITFRVDKPTYDQMWDICKDLGINISELSRRIVHRTLMEVTIYGRKLKTYDEVRKEFVRIIKNRD